jgi:ABC-type uncharacterized transport system substrate-binding protein
MKLWLSVLTLSGCIITSAQAANCFYINSYHQGYEWSDRIQAQFAQDVKGICNISYHYLNAKKETNPSRLKNKGMEIANLIALSQPDIVIAADDAASEYVVNPYLRNGQTPVVYVGINWDPRPLGYPMRNATGMTEVWPIQQALNTVKNTIGAVTKMAFITADNPLEKRDEQAIRKIMDKNDVQLNSYFVRNFEEWKQAIKMAQGSDAINLGTVEGIKYWDKEAAISWLKEYNQRFIFANQDFMMPYAMYSLSKSPEEFGHWAAELTKTIFKGDQPWQIPIIPNRIFISRYNPDLLSSSHFKIPDAVIRQSIVYKDN